MGKWEVFTKITLTPQIKMLRSHLCCHVKLLLHKLSFIMKFFLYKTQNNVEHCAAIEERYKSMNRMSSYSKRKKKSCKEILVIILK